MREAIAALGVLMLSSVMFCTASVAAQTRADPDASSDVLGIQIHGFASPGFLLSTGNNYLAKTKRGSPEFAEVGLNFTRAFGDQLTTGIQLFSRDLGPIGNYSAKLDWFYVDYHPRDWFGIRAGRIKIPFGLYNEFNDVDAARVSVLLPQSIYPIENRDFLLAQTGGEVYGHLLLGPVGAVDYRLYGGTIFLETTSSPGQPYDLVSLDNPYVFGGRILYAPPIEGLRLGGSVQVLRLDARLLFDPKVYAPLQTAGALPQSFDGRVDIEIPALLWVASAEFVSQGLQLAAEYSRWHVESRSDTPALFPESNTTSERMYAMVSYVTTPWLTPGAYYSILYADVDKRSGRAAYQRDAALTFRFDLTEHWLVKLEGHYMSGTAALRSNLNGDRPLSQLDKDWFLLAAKTTAYF